MAARAEAQPAAEPTPTVLAAQPSGDPAATAAPTSPVETQPPLPPEAQSNAQTAVPADQTSATAPEAAFDAAAVPAAEAAPPAAEPEDDWTKHVKIGGGAILWYYQPFLDEVDNNVEFYNARLVVDAALGDFGFHFEPRIRDTKLRGFFDGPAWLQEAYGSWNTGPYALIKLGKSYSQLGLFWDNSFYGNVQVYDGLKLAPDYGISIEGSTQGQLGLDYWLQFFLVDGRTNVSLAQRDTLSIAGARKRNELVAKVEPYYEFSDSTSLRLGLSVQAFEADLPTGDDNVRRLAAHAKLVAGGLGVWVEGLLQDGRHVSDFPYAGTPGEGDEDPTPGRSSAKNRYLLAGAEYTIEGFTLRYNASLGDYHDVDVNEWMHVPSLSYQINALLSLSAELVIWTRNAPEGDSDVDKSLNVLLYAGF